MRVTVIFFSKNGCTTRTLSNAIVPTLGNELELNSTNISTNKVCSSMLQSDVSTVSNMIGTSMILLLGYQARLC
jgi:hypothetical protein